MENRTGALLPVLLVGTLLATGCSESSRTGGRSEEGEGGAQLFARYCATCHPGGGNILNPSKTLQRLTLAANGITTPEGIVARMRNPGRGMKRFDPEEISDAKGRRIAAYILETFR